MIRKSINIVLASASIIGIFGCNQTEPKLPQELRGSISDVTEYLILRGKAPCLWLNDKDFDGDGVNDSYVMPKYGKRMMYHTNSMDPQPTNCRDIRWYLAKSDD